MDTPNLEQLSSDWIKQFNAAQTSMRPEITDLFVRLCVIEGKGTLAPIPVELRNGFAWRLMDSRLKAQVSDCVKAFLQSLCESPGDITMWCYALNALTPKDAVVNTDVLAHLFPNGFPSRQQLDDLWEAQKVAGLGNLVDYASPKQL